MITRGTTKNSWSPQSLGKCRSQEIPLGKCESQEILLGKNESQKIMGEEGNSNKKRRHFLQFDFCIARGSWVLEKEHHP
jgi:hypothetical protein